MANVPQSAHLVNHAASVMVEKLGAETVTDPRARPKNTRLASALRLLAWIDETTPVYLKNEQSFFGGPLGTTSYSRFREGF